MVDKNIIQSRFTKLGVVPIDNQHYLYATLDNNLIGIIVVIKTCDKHYYEEENIKVNARIGNSVKSRVVSSKQVPEVQTVEQLSIQYERPVFSTVKRGRGKREESKLQLSLFD